jgi:hypothetical protein
MTWSVELPGPPNPRSDSRHCTGGRKGPHGVEFAGWCLAKARAARDKPEGTLMTNEPKRTLELMAESYEWFSRVGRREISLSDVDMARYFTQDVRMLVDNVVKADGITSLQERFREMLARTSRWEAVLLTPSLSEGNRAAAYCQYRFVDTDGKRGVVHTCSIWTLREGRIAEICEVASFEGLRLDLASHG